MPHSYTCIWIHAVWATKYRQPIIYPEIEQTLYNYISEQLKEMRCTVRIINGMPDHVHCLFSLPRNASINKVIKQIKGSSSRFINENNLIEEHFEWQVGYSAFSVSRFNLDKVYNYIKKQKIHHAKTSFEDEYEEMMRMGE